ncbi:MAG: hypothetical protein HYU36_07820 [Planctomycetes bacterium]|nr:hypothetical protein [Planctomycetota bacterium]
MVEFLAVALIIGLFSALIVKGMEVMSAKSKLLECSSKVKSIAQAVETYSNNWGGWTPPNGHQYPSLFMLPVFGESPFVQGVANGAKDFICPVSGDPQSTRYITTGYKSSYQLASSYIGFNRMAASRSVVVVANDIAKRHASGKSKGAVYALSNGSQDLSGGSAKQPKYMPGLLSRWWNVGGYNPAPAGYPAVELVWSENLARQYEDGLGFLPRGTYDPITPAVNAIADWDLSTANEPDNVMGRWEGFLDFPSAGAWTISVRCDNSGGFGVDDNEDGVVSVGERRGPTAGPTDYPFVLATPGRHAVEFYFFEGAATHFFEFSWTGPGFPKAVIAVNFMSHMP